MKTAVLGEDAGGHIIYNRALVDFARHHGFHPRACRPYRAKTKGKVERFNRYLRHSFFVPLAARYKQAGLEVDSGSANREVRRWLAEVANVREHASPKQRPLDRWQNERASLQPLPALYPGLRAPTPSVPQHVPTPFDSFQHPLAKYAEIALEIAA